MMQVTLTTLGICIDLLGPLYSEYANEACTLLMFDRMLSFSVFRSSRFLEMMLSAVVHEQIQPFQIFPTLYDFLLAGGSSSLKQSGAGVGSWVQVPTMAQTGHGGHGGHGSYGGVATGKTGSFGSNKSQKGFSKNTSTPGEKKLTESPKMPMSTKSHKSTSRSPRISPRNLRSPRISPSPRSPRTSSSKVSKSSQPTGASCKMPGPSLPSGDGQVATQVEVVQPVRSPGEPNSEITCQTVNVDESLVGRSVKSGKIMKVKSGNGTSEVENDSDDAFPEAGVSSTGKTGKGRAKFLEKNDLS